MKKIISLFVLTALTACGGGSITETSTPQVVKLSAKAIAELPVPFTVGPQPQTPTTPQFVVGPSGTVPSPVVVGPTPPTVTFVTGPVVGPTVIVTPPVVIGPSVVAQPVINYCTDGFVVGPCTPFPTTCQPDTSGFVIGPCKP